AEPLAESSRLFPRQPQTTLDLTASSDRNAAPLGWRSSSMRWFIFTHYSCHACILLILLESLFPQERENRTRLTQRTPLLGPTCENQDDIPNPVRIDRRRTSVTDRADTTPRTAAQSRHSPSSVTAKPRWTLPPGTERLVSYVAAGPSRRPQGP